MNTAYLALGSNLGDREAHLRFAIAELKPVRVSKIHETEPVGYLDQGPFLNCVCEVQTEFSPWALLDEIHRIENLAGRQRPFPNAPRTLDIDIVLYSTMVLISPRLTIPHPRFRERPFVLIPLAELTLDFDALAPAFRPHQSHADD